jgi:predicted DNA-binding protein (MmcQ/YjbR family)
MDLDSIRSFCLSLPHARENVQWGDELCFKVCGRIFAMVSLASVPQRLIFKCDPETFAQLTELADIVPAPYLGRYGWVMLQRTDVLSDSEIENLLRQSYAMVSAKLHPKHGRQTHKKSPQAKTRRRSSKAKM